MSNNKMGGPVIEYIPQPDGSYKVYLLNVRKGEAIPAGVVMSLPFILPKAPVSMEKITMPVVVPYTLEELREEELMVTALRDAGAGQELIDRALRQYQENKMEERGRDDDTTSG
jgi:hypothetical protein